MNIPCTKIGLAIALLVIAPLTYAGFVFEKGAEPLAAAASKARADGRIAVAATSGGRNVNPSAPSERISKINRQRIDLESRVSSRITQSGNSPTELQSLRGLGRGVAFEDALRQVLPVGWSVFSDQDAPLAKVVDWRGGRTWPMVMHAVLETMDMRAHIDWDAQELMLFVPAPVESVEKPAEIVTQADGSAAPAATTVASAAIVAGTVPAASVALATPRISAVGAKDGAWSVKPGSLRENLRVLAAQVGWTLVWNATIGDMTVNYDVEAPGYQFTGALVGSEGVIAKVIDLYAHAEHPLAVTFFHGNKVIEVRLHEVPDVKSGPAATVVAVPQVSAPATR